jgi:putative ATP-binding cassette transporter
MLRPKVPLNRATWDRFWNMIKSLVSDPIVGRTAVIYMATLILFLFVINGLNVINSYVGRDFMTAIEQRDRAGFAWQGLRWVGVFALLTGFSVLSRYFEESLGLLWRKWLTWRAVRRYADNRVYFRMAEGGQVANPDQRIADDIRAFTATTLSFTLMLLNGILTVVAFSGVLFSISPLLFMVAVVYATAGTYLTLKLGRPLIHLNYDQLDKEADFRASLIHLRENADLVALSRREAQLALKSKRALDNLADNFRRIISINRNVGFFTTGYNWLVQLIPALIVAPMFFSGSVEFGVITQSAMAFTHLLGAFSLIVTQFQSISSFAAVITRIGVLTEASRNEEKAEVAASKAATAGWQAEGSVAYRDLTLHSPRSGRILVSGLTAETTAGRNLLVYGRDETARAAVFRATAGIWPVTAGEVVRPLLDRILFVTERPYVSPSTLRDLFLRPRPDRKPNGPDFIPEINAQELEAPPEDVAAALNAVGLDGMLERFGGLDSHRDWDSILSLAEQQLLVLARVVLAKPDFVFLDRPGTALGPDLVDRVLQLLRERSITYVVFEETPQRESNFQDVLELKPEGAWDLRPARPVLAA